MPILATVRNTSIDTQRDRLALARNQRLLIQLVYGGSLWLCVFLQAVIAPDYINIASAIISAVTGTLVAVIMLGPIAFSTRPLSAFSVVGVNVVTTSGALWFQTLGWRALTFNLDVPLQTFMIGSAFSLSCVLAHVIYSHFQGLHALRASASRSLFKPLGVYDAPSTPVLWIMGGVGVLAMLATGTAEARQAIEFGNVGGKLGEILTPFAVAPFLIPLAGALLDHPGATARKVNWAALAGYFALLVIIAMARNSRSTFANIFAIAGLGLVLAVISGRIIIGRRAVLISAIGGCAVLFLAPVFSNISAAMLINRATRSEVSAGALISNTVETMNNKALIENFESTRRILTSGYNEIYISNEFLGRFNYIKYLDLNLKHSQGLNAGQREVAREAFSDRLLATLPTPLLQRLGISIDKADLQYSGGDLYRFLASSRSLGGFTVGSPVADGLIVFGPFFWPVCMAMFLAAFFMIDALSSPLSPIGFPLSPIAAISLPYIFIYVFMKDSMAVILGWFLRGYWQSIIMYLVVYHVLNIVTKSLPDGFVGTRRVQLAGRRSGT